ncbi:MULTISPECIES: hypothetical protein [unclassified Proteiniphilum]|jgi:iduronate 2-sulfatase|uniref:hypothetical protein n=1 Tax=Proteiniphilum sp. UBA5346 TaxID=1947277 RepID=UPI00257A6550|nr:MULTISPECIES: hypothetical protein [unclassified Proteiniphilum]
MNYIREINSELLIEGMTACSSLISAKQTNQEMLKNILMILIDNLKFNLGCYVDRNEKSLNIYKLAESGIRLNIDY